MARSGWSGLKNSLHGLARLEMLNTEMMELPKMEGILRRAALVYIPGGNTFLLNHRLHISRLMPYLKKKVQSGLPVVAFSAGTVLCGPNILTSNDLNSVATPHFDGLNVTPFNFNVHYTGDLERDNWLVDYHVFHDNPLIIMADGSYVKLRDGKCNLKLVRCGFCEKGEKKKRSRPGELITT